MQHLNLDCAAVNHEQIAVRLFFLLLPSDRGGLFLSGDRQNVISLCTLQILGELIARYNTVVLPGWAEKKTSKVHTNYKLARTKADPPAPIIGHPPSRRTLDHPDPLPHTLAHPGPLLFPAARWRHRPKQNGGTSSSPQQPPPRASRDRIKTCC